MKSFSNIAKKGKVPWVRLWIDATWDFCENFIDRETGKVDYEALGREEYEFRKALKYGEFEKNERAKFLWDEAVAKHTAKSENGKLGGRPRKEATSPEQTSTNDNGHGAVVVPPPMNKAPRKKASSAPCLPSWQQVIDYADERRLDYQDAREWYEMTVVDRKGHDRDGNKIANLKASLIGFCKVKEGKRRTA